MPDATPFSERLKKWRASLGLLQKEAAFELGVPASTFYRWEDGTRKPGKLASVELERRMEAAKKK